MTTIKILTRVISLAKGAFAIILLAFSSQVFAEYYVAYSVVELGCATPCCMQSCNTRVVYEKPRPVRVYAPPVKRMKTRDTYSTCGSSEQRYTRPSCSKVVRMSACGDCVEYRSSYETSYCNAPNCQDFFVPPEYYTAVSNVDEYMDERTADDF